MLGSDGFHGVGLGQAGGDGGAPPGEDVVADDDVVGLDGAGESGHDGGKDLILGEGVGGESDGKRHEGFDVEIG